MNLRDLARRIFGGTSGLRNKPGGMAWIRRHGEDFGAGVMVGRVVRTVRVIEGHYWLIDPPQPYTPTRDNTDVRGNLSKAGELTNVIALADDLLEPIRAPGKKERSEELAWQPKVPAPGREMSHG